LNIVIYTRVLFRSPRIPATFAALVCCTKRLVIAKVDILVIDSNILQRFELTLLTPQLERVKFKMNTFIQKTCSTLFWFNPDCCSIFPVRDALPLCNSPRLKEISKVATLSRASLKFKISLQLHRNRIKVCIANCGNIKQCRKLLREGNKVESLFNSHRQRPAILGWQARVFIFGVSRSSKGNIVLKTVSALLGAWQRSIEVDNLKRVEIESLRRLRTAPDSRRASIF
jgi:hypothetical protein